MLSLRQTALDPDTGKIAYNCTTCDDPHAAAHSKDDLEAICITTRAPTPPPTPAPVPTPAPPPPPPPCHRSPLSPGGQPSTTFAGCVDCATLADPNAKDACTKCESDYCLTNGICVPRGKSCAMGGSHEAWCDPDDEESGKGPPSSPPCIACAKNAFNEKVPPERVNNCATCAAKNPAAKDLEAICATTKAPTPPPTPPPPTPAPPTPKPCRPWAPDPGTCAYCDQNMTGCKKDKCFQYTDDNGEKLKYCWAGQCGDDADKDNWCWENGVCIAPGESCGAATGPGQKEDGKGGAGMHGMYCEEDDYKDLWRCSGKCGTLFGGQCTECTSTKCLDLPPKEWIVLPSLKEEEWSGSTEMVEAVPLAGHEMVIDSKGIVYVIGGVMTGSCFGGGDEGCKYGPSDRVSCFNCTIRGARRNGWAGDPLTGGQPEADEVNIQTQDKTLVYKGKTWAAMKNYSLNNQTGDATMDKPRMNFAAVCTNSDLIVVMGGTAGLDKGVNWDTYPYWRACDRPNPESARRRGVTAPCWRQERLRGSKGQVGLGQQRLRDADWQAALKSDPAGRAVRARIK